MKFTKQRIFLLFFCINCFLNPVKGQIDSLLVKLEETMVKQSVYEKHKILIINNIKEFLREPGLEKKQIFYFNKKLIKEYVAFSFDSTVKYINKNIKLAEYLNDTLLLNEARLSLADLLAKSGRYKEAQDILDELDKKRLKSSLLFDYYNIYKIIYAEILSFTLTEEVYKEYKQKYEQYFDSLLNINKGKKLQLRLQEEKFRYESRIFEAQKINSERLNLSKSGERDYSIACYERSLLYNMVQDFENQKKYLILSAISDIEGAIKDNASLTSLALTLYKENKIEKSFKYINFAYQDALFFNSRLRFLRISNVFPVITDAYEHENEVQRQLLFITLVIISFLTILLILSVFYVLRQIKKVRLARNELSDANKKLSSLNKKLNHTNSDLKLLNNDLSEANLIKEQYIGTFLTECSNYIDKLDKFRSTVYKKIVAREISDLLDKTKSKQMIKEELRIFYSNFDTTFLKIYPHFVQEVNSLLCAECSLVPKTGELLSTEHRIFALIRLGISDSAGIARLLRYSVNTIYNYRAKVKNFSKVPREEFEDYIMKIGKPKS